jgi:hypothetical protein
MTGSPRGRMHAVHYVHERTSDDALRGGDSWGEPARSSHSARTERLVCAGSLSPAFPAPVSVGRPPEATTSSPENQRFSALDAPGSHHHDAHAARCIWETPWRRWLPVCLPVLPFSNCLISAKRT